MVIGNYKEPKSNLKDCKLFKRTRGGGGNRSEKFERNEIKKERYQKEKFKKKKKCQKKRKEVNSIKKVKKKKSAHERSVN